MKPDERRLVDAFHQFAYREGTFFGAMWRGVPMAKWPPDMFMYQELLVELRPDYLIETGTFQGGSALFFADVMELIGHGHVITMDVEKQDNLPAHKRITYMQGDSVDSRMIEAIEDIIGGRRSVMVSLDSDHHKAHVLAEMEAYAPLVGKGGYMVVEDTNIGHPVMASGPWKGYAPKEELMNNGPAEAVAEFLHHHPEWAVDEASEKFLISLSPGGWLYRRESGG